FEQAGIAAECLVEEQRVGDRRSPDFRRSNLLVEKRGLDLIIHDHKRFVAEDLDPLPRLEAQTGRTRHYGADCTRLEGQRKYRALQAVVTAESAACMKRLY